MSPNNREVSFAMKRYCAVVGYGRWGRVLCRKLSDSPHFSLKYVCDTQLWQQDELNKALTKGIEDRDPSLIYTTSLDQVLRDPEVQAVFIATPPSQHFSVALASLKAKKHVWLEKPCCESGEELVDLIELASRSRLILHLDFIMLFNPLIQEMKKRSELVFSARYKQFTAIRHNTVQPCSLTTEERGRALLVDLGVHDLSVLKYFEPKLEVTELDLVLRPHPECERSFERWCLSVSNDSLSASLDLSWSAQNKQRVIEWSDLNQRLRCLIEDQSRAASVSKRGCAVESLYLLRQQGRELIERLDESSIDPLSRAIASFEYSIKQGRPPEQLWSIGIWIHDLIKALPKAPKCREKNRTTSH